MDRASKREAKLDRRYDDYIRRPQLPRSNLWLDFTRDRDVKLNRPALVVAVSTSLPQYRALYSQARELAKYMLRKMSFEQIATMHSSAFAPEVLIRDDGLSTLPSCAFYLNRGRRDLLLFCGDTSPMDDQYEFTRIILNYANEVGVKELYSVGARWTENPLSPELDPQPNGFATDRAGIAKLEKHGVKLIAEEPAPFFASMVVGLAKGYGIRGYKLSVDHGEPSPHPKSVAKLLGILSLLAGFEVSVDELRSQAGTVPQPRQVGDSTIYH